MTDSIGIVAASNVAKDDSVLSVMRSRMTMAISALSGTRDSELDDLRFYAGSPDNQWQWPNDVLQTRGSSQGPVVSARPCLTINKLPQHVKQITNEQRMNRPTIKVLPVDDKSDIEMADVFNGVIRHIEYTSDADVAYDTACENQVTYGEGYLRILTEYCDDTSFDQEIKIGRIRNSFSVYMDPMIQDPAGADARWCFITDDMTKDEYERAYPKASPISTLTARGIGDSSINQWISETTVRVAEYFYIECEKATLNLYPGNQTALTGTPEDSLLRAMFGKPLRSRQSDRERVKWCKTNGYEILEESEWAGSFIPVVRVVGNEFEVDGQLYVSGLVRNAKDAQRMYNYWPLALDTPVPTPHGWSTIGELRPGDEVFDECGAPVEVVDTTAVFLNEDCYRVTFDDGSSIVASGNHQWRVERRGKRTSATFEWSPLTVSTRDLVPGDDFIRVTRPLQTSRSVPLDPYFVGVWLGDGDSSGPIITQNKADADEMIDILVSRGLDAGNLRASSTACRFSVYGVRSEMVALNLLGNKHVPDCYLRASIEDRLELLRGLMDTDGSVGANGQCSISTTSPTLRDGICELLRSLGVKFGVVARDGRVINSPNGKTYHGADHWQISFSCRDDLRVFNLTRKIARTIDRLHHPRRTTRFGIATVERVASVPVKCITVASDNHLFLAGEGMVPTHNCSQEAEMLALAPKAPFIGYGGQFEGYEQQWKTANTQNWPYLEVNPDVTDGQGAVLPLPQRAQPPMASSGLLQAKAGASEDIKSTTGQYNASLGMTSNERSGKAILARQRESDVGTYHYADNLARAVRHIGRQLVDLIPKIYDTARVARILGEDGEPSTVKMNPDQEEPVKKIMGPGGVVVDKIYNPRVGKYDVRVITGPGYATKRQEALESMAQLLQGNPQLWQVAGDLFVKNMDWPGAQDLAKRLQKMLDPKVMADEDNPALVAANQQMEAMNAEMQQMFKMLQNVQQSMEAKEMHIKQFEAEIKAYQAETQRISAVQAGMTPEQIQDIVMGTIAAAVDAGDLIASAPEMRENPQPDTPRMPQMSEPQGTPSQTPYEEQQ